MRTPRVLVSRRRRSSRRGTVGVVGEDGEERAEAALLHLNGGGHDVESAQGEGPLGDVGEDLRGEIVDGGFEDGDEDWVASFVSPMLRRRTLGKSLGLRVPAP